MTDEEQRSMILWKTLDVPVGCVAHHCILQQTLRNHGHSDKLWDFRNRLVLTRAEHERHHAGFAPIRRDRLPESVREFALELDGGNYAGYFTDWLERHYVAGETYKTGTGQVIHNVHEKGECRGDHCVIHNPSDHCMRSFPTHWRDDRGIMERICPHGVGHPDPDQTFDDPCEWVHGCDGCCSGDEAA